MGLNIGGGDKFRANERAVAAPVWEMTSEQYVARAITIAVYPMMEAGQLCLSAADEAAETQVERFKQSLQPIAPANHADPAGWAASKVRDLFAAVNKANSDIWYGELPGMQPLLVIKQAAIDEKSMTLEQAVRKAHLAQVAAALNDGLSVPDAVRREYRLEIEALAAREVQ
jgi:hypothetical protein